MKKRLLLVLLGLTLTFSSAPAVYAITDVQLVPPWNNDGDKDNDPDDDHTYGGGNRGSIDLYSEPKEDIPKPNKPHAGHGRGGSGGSGGIGRHGLLLPSRAN